MRATPAVLAITLGALAAACGVERPDPAAPSLTAGGWTGLSASAWGPETPPFNNEIILRDVSGENGFGHVKFRQPNDADKIVYLDTWVRDLAPNASYRLQRAVDTQLDDVCTGTGWLTLGQGTTPAAIVTDARGTGRAALFRNLGATPTGTEFDIHFRVVTDASPPAVVLQSGCYQFVVDP